MAARPILDETQLEAICEVLGATDIGLTGSEIGRYLRDYGVSDPAPSPSKHHRLYGSISTFQPKDGCANGVFAVMTFYIQLNLD